MDPNEALRLIRAYIKQMRAEDKTPLAESADLLNFVQHARDLAETFEVLDEWLSKDGFLPSDWLSDDEKNQTLGDGSAVKVRDEDPETCAACGAVEGTPEYDGLPALCAAWSSAPNRLTTGAPRA